MRVHLFDPQLGAVEGHYRSYDGAVVSGLEQRRVACSVYGFANPVDTDTSGLSVEPVFNREIFAEVSTDAHVWAFENFEKLNDEVFADLSRLDPGRFTARDIAYFPNILQNQIDGIRRWVLSLPQASRPVVVLKPAYLTHMMPYMQQRTNKDLTALLMRYALRRLLAEHPRTRILTNTGEIANLLQRMAEVPVSLLPQPLSAGKMPPRGPAKGPLNVVYLGHASPLKGFDLLPDLVARSRGAKPAHHFTIQAYNEYSRLIAGELQSLDELCTVVMGVVDRETYLDLLAKADILLLPYSREYYGWASSGIFVEGLTAGKVMVVPHDSWMSREAERLGAGVVTFSQLTSESVGSALNRALSDFAALSQKANLAAHAARRENSPTAYVDLLLAAAKSA